MQAELIVSKLDTPIGDLIIVQDGKTVVICEFADHDSRVARQLGRYYGGTHVKNGPCDTQIAAQFAAYFGGDSEALQRLDTAPEGTVYEKQVWAHLKTIPAGNTTSYGAMAKQLASSPRAVGRANGRNPVALIHPCHRVIGADGNLTGYAGGLNRKEWLLQHEGALLPL